jgi:hypothetical protein
MRPVQSQPSDPRFTSHRCLATSTAPFSLSDDGVLGVIVSEMVEFDPPRRYVRKLPYSQVPRLEAHSLAAVPEGSSYTITLASPDLPHGLHDDSIGLAPMRPSTAGGASRGSSATPAAVKR